jgi:hypothetical protein
VSKIPNYLAYQVEDPEPDREKTEKSEFKKFWFLFVPLGCLAGFFACIVGDSGSYFIPVGGIAVFVLWAVLSRNKSE